MLYSKYWIARVNADIYKGSVQKHKIIDNTCLVGFTNVLRKSEEFVKDFLECEGFEIIALKPTTESGVFDNRLIVEII